MRDVSDKAYYERRARSEIRKANTIDDPTAKRVHLALAANYLKQARSMDEALDVI
ncbi:MULTISPECIES: hypothetical protein [Sphingobium]|uniref:Uncharacterized protein n=1 Tax=Sphingobium fuliginis (strain ATCC 27551) TaxID=336203 RepID=A0ABQ1ES99_SPHSA|nr:MULTISPECIES: hypothetical protein [Sphingobium]WDA36686.1 hypothetical protein PO876_00245 [Sphingobium sp. YC-XJ3]GFZ85060.1 hypothetical protein GCM10019071_12600 [Sphingobium fuliginis]